MGKTFEEWYKEVGCYFDYQIEVTNNFVYVADKDMLQMLKAAWNASRQNMTTTPGLSFCKDCGGPYSVHHDCRCGNCNG